MWALRASIISIHYLIINSAKLCHNIPYRNSKFPRSRAWRDEISVPTCQWFAIVQHWECSLGWIFEVCRLMHTRSSRTKRRSNTLSIFQTPAVSCVVRWDLSNYLPMFCENSWLSELVCLLNHYTPKIVSTLRQGIASAGSRDRCASVYRNHPIAVSVLRTSCERFGY